MKKKYHKEDILEKGAQIIRTKGYHNTGINDVLEACEIPRGSFYNFFESKEAFGLQVIAYYGEQYHRFVLGFLLDTQYSPLHRLKNLYVHFIEWNRSESFQKGCLVNNLCQEIAGLHQSFSEALENQFKVIIQEISLCIQEAQQIGEIRDDYSANYLAEFLHNNAIGAQARMKSSRDASPLKLFYQMTFDFLEKKN
ncbi:MAG: TetR family transcriptional regulator C-terminal domain-containing protein [Microscillaceae bacterium]|nr:TetR family transcriptional regulator C-terminal domain-containing protein [Microscillaceae bacterium]